MDDCENLYNLSGYVEWAGKMGVNNIVSGLRGPNDIKFPDG